MAIRFYNKMGKMTIKQRDKKFKIDIWSGNCLAVFNYEYKDKETGKDMISLYNFFNDKQHVKNIIKNNGSLFGDEVSNIELNLAYDCKDLLDIFIKNGYKVKCYYKKDK